MNPAAGAAALARFGCIAVTLPTPIGAGTLNDNYLVHTHRGAFVLRRIRDDQPDARVANEHATIRWVAARGFPVPRPIEPVADAMAGARDTPPPVAGRAAMHDDELPSTCVRIAPDRRAGATAHSRWAMFPFVTGRRIARGALTAAESAALGGVHGRLHAVLRDHPRSAGAEFAMQWSAEQSAAALERVDAAARSSGASAETLDGIALQRRMLDALDVRPPSAFAQLPSQWLHGDFHVEQALFHDDANVAAILDWELCQANARAWELVRSLAFSGLLGARPNARAYLRAYVRHAPIERDELALGMALWWQSRVVGVWVWWAAFVERNERVHGLIPDTLENLRRMSQRGWCDRVTRHVLDAARP